MFEKAVIVNNLDPYNNPVNIISQSIVSHTCCSKIFIAIVFIGLIKIDFKLKTLISLSIGKKSFKILMTWVIIQSFIIFFKFYFLYFSL
jgi:hypothetical protein